MINASERSRSPESPVTITGIRTEIEAVTIEAFKTATHASGTEHIILQELRRAQALAVSLVAEQNGNIVGHVAVSPVAISDGTKHWYGVGPISVLPSEQGNGVGTELMSTALEQLRAIGACGCVVLGDPSYYRRFGFAPVSSLMLPGVPAEYFQAVALGTDIPQGTVSYHKAFEA